jgi:hypothetical protein
VEEGEEMRGCCFCGATAGGRGGVRGVEGLSICCVREGGGEKKI